MNMNMNMNATVLYCSYCVWVESQQHWNWLKLGSQEILLLSVRLWSEAGRRGEVTNSLFSSQWSWVICDILLVLNIITHLFSVKIMMRISLMTNVFTFIFLLFRYADCPHQACAMLPLTNMTDGLRESSNLWNQGNKKEVCTLSVSTSHYYSYPISLTLFISLTHIHTTHLPAILLPLHYRWINAVLWTSLRWRLYSLHYLEVS